MYGTILAVLVISCAFIDKAVGLQCYDCSSLSHPECGKSFDFTMTEAKQKNLVKTCEGATVACRKTETDDTHKNKVIYSRSCWNGTTEDTLKEDFYECKKLMVNAQVCYCKGDKDELCNGQERIKGNHISFVMGLPLLLLCLIF